MDEPLKELEDELGRLRPARPSFALEARIEAELARRETVNSASPTETGAAQRHRRVAWSLCVAAAAAAVALVGLRPRATVIAPSDSSGPGSEVVTAEPAAAAEYRPVAAKSVFYGVSAESGVYMRDQTPVQQVRYRYLDTYTWKNAATHASMQWTVPRDEIRVIPASLH
jgi:hypothetical protein